MMSSLRFFSVKPEDLNDDNDTSLLHGPFSSSKYRPGMYCNLLQYIAVREKEGEMLIVSYSEQLFCCATMNYYLNAPCNALQLIATHPWYIK